MRLLKAGAAWALALLILALFAVALEGLAALGGVTPLADDPRYVSRVSHRHCQFGADHVRSRCAPRRVSGTRPYVVLALGGSNVGGHAKGPQALFPRRLADRLEAAEPGRYEVVNMGRMCKDSSFVRRCAEVAAPARPDLLVVYSGHNDYANWGLENPARRIWLEDHAWLYDLEISMARSRLFSAASRRLTSRGASVPLPDAESEDRRFEAAEDVVLARFTENVEGLIDAARARGTAVVLVTLVSNLAEFPQRQARWGAPIPDALLTPRQRRAADAYREGIELFRERRLEESLDAFIRARDLHPAGRATSRLNQRIREIGRRHDVPVIDLERILYARALAEGTFIGCNYFGSGRACDQFHMNEIAHDMLAEELFRSMRGGALQ